MPDEQNSEDSSGIHNLTTENLVQFYGSQTYTHHWTKKIVMTDGAQFINTNDCGWWLDIIASYQNDTLWKKSRGFQFWKLRKLDNDPKFMAVAICEDGDYNELVRQKIEFTNFPFNQLENGLDMYVEEGSIDGKTTCWVCMLTSER
jgi:hypothetical protein